MPSFCPACGSGFVPDARFCMKCGKERPEAERAAAGAAAAGTATAPAMPPAPPPPAVPPPLPGGPPSYAPYAPPSRGALFLRRTFTGDWAGSAKAAAWPSALLLVLALAVSLPSPGDYEALGLGNWSDRFPAAIALLLQGLGAGLEVESRSGGGLLSMFIRGSGSVSVWPLTITALWAGATALGARRLRRTPPAGPGGGAEATVRIALICAAVVLVLGLYGQPDLALFSVSTTPVLAALFSGALAGVVSGAVLCRDEAAARLGAGAQMAVRAWGTALRALGLSVALCGLIVFFVIASHPDEAGDWAWAGSLPVLANLGLMALGLSWGAGVESSSTERGRHTGDTLGLSEIGDLAGGWAQAGAVAVGLACAVILAVTAARRSADRTEQVLSGVFFLATLWLLSFVSGGAMEMTTGTSFSSRPRGTDASIATNAGELLLFGLLWTAGAILLAGALGHTRGPAFMSRPNPLGPPLPTPAPPMPTAPHRADQPPAAAAPGAASAAGSAGAQPASPAGGRPTAEASGAAVPGTPSVAPAAGSAAAQPAAHPAPAAAPQPMAAAPSVAPVATPAAAQPAAEPASAAAPQSTAAAFSVAPAATPAAAQPAAEPAPAESAAGPAVAQPAAPAGARAAAHSAPHLTAPAAGPASHTGTQPLAYAAQHAPFAPAPAHFTATATTTGALPPARSVRRPLVWGAIGLAAFLVGGAAMAGVMLVGNSKSGGDGGEDAKGPAARSQAPSGAPTGGGDAPTVAPSASASATPGPRPQPPKGEVPKGFQRMTSPEGFSLAVPEYWRRENRGSNQIDYAGPTGPGHIRVGIVPSGGTSAYDHFREMEKTVGRQEGYTRVQMTANTFLGRPGALWEWTWKEKNGEVMRALNQAYVDEKGTEYAIMYTERERFHPDARKVFDTALRFWWVGPYDVR
ncbi:zinc ribbon domain-containing protein [Streptomyces sp. NPDC046261]|uniref:zinc ribbon domain-containing protein n=1 Tax=Streptomyces sp. NPDC046261 TaxID=3157200 RepID=UPI0033EB7D69